MLLGMPPDRLSDQMGAIYRMWLRWSISLIRHGVIRAGLPSIQTSGEVSSVRALRLLPLRCLVCLPLGAFLPLIAVLFPSAPP
jgi:hypothetical protein